MLENRRIYQNLDDKELKKLFSTLQSNTQFYKTDQTIAYALGNRNLIGIIEDGTAKLVRFDYDGKRTILDEMAPGDIFSDMFIPSDSSELLVIATTDCHVTFIEYDSLARESKTNKSAAIILDNLVRLISKKLIKRNERIELLTQRSIRNKLLRYFELERKKKNSKSFDLKYSYTDLADYLSIDRSAMMRELKNLKEDKLITDVNKKITILY